MLECCFPIPFNILLAWVKRVLNRRKSTSFRSCARRNSRGIRSTTTPVGLQTGRQSKVFPRIRSVYISQNQPSIQRAGNVLSASGERSGQGAVEDSFAATLLMHVPLIPYPGSSLTCHGRQAIRSANHRSGQGYSRVRDSVQVSSTRLKMSAA
jgi:hypothetical protein